MQSLLGNCLLPKWRCRGSPRYLRKYRYLNVPARNLSIYGGYQSLIANIRSEQPNPTALHHHLIFCFCSVSPQLMVAAACLAEIVNQVLASTASTAVRPPHVVNLLPDLASALNHGSSFLLGQRSNFLQCSCKLPVYINVDLYTLRTLNSTKNWVQS